MTIILRVIWALRDFVMVDVPEEHKAGFSAAHYASYLKRGRVMLGIVGAVLTAVVLSFARPGVSAALGDDTIVFMAMDGLLTAAFGILYLMMRQAEERLVPAGLAGHLDYVTHGLVLAWCLTVSIVDQRSSSDITTYLTGCLALLAITRLRPVWCLLSLATTQAVLCGLLLAVQSDSATALSLSLNSSLFAMCVFLVHRHVFVDRVSLFIKGLESEARNSDLEQKSLELARLNSILKRDSEIDSLTGLPNRRAADSALAREWGRCIREGEPIAVLVIDVDYFKEFNDLYGHLEGDACLQRVADTLRHTVKRSTDVVARFGGDEFIAILANTSKRGAARVARNMLRGVEACAIPHAASRVSPLQTVSIGAATSSPTAESSPFMMLQVADRALYDSKHRGRNTLTIAEAEPDAVLEA